MQGYLKFKEKEEELYEIEIKEEESNSRTKKLTNLIMRRYLRFVAKIKKWFHIITVKEIYSGLIFIFPMLSSEKNIQKHLEKCIPKVKKLMKKYQVSQVILTEELRQNETFMQKFLNDEKTQAKIHILDGKGIMFYLVKEIIEYISNKQGKTTELEDLYLLIKQDNYQYQANILSLAQYFKNINIVTPSLKVYQKLAKQFEERYDIIIPVTNNRKKSLKRAKWVINFDLTKEEIQKYAINRTATIIYLNQAGIYEENSFEGLHICQAGIDISQEIKDFFAQQNLLEQFPLTILYESTIQKKKNFNQIKEQMKKDAVRIERLYGRRGVLVDKEYDKTG